MIEDLEAALLRQHEVEQDEVGRLGVEKADGLLAVGGLHGFVVLHVEVDLQPLPQARFVFNDQNFGHMTSSVAGCRLPVASEHPQPAPGNW